MIESPRSGHALTHSVEVPAGTTSGYVMLGVACVAAVVAIACVVLLANNRLDAIFAIVPGVATLVAAFIACGFYMLQSNQAAAITLFGSYKDTDRTSGLRWVLPWLIRKTIAVRANNIISDKIKVNDLRGNPTEMAASGVARGRYRAGAVRRRRL